MGLGILGLLELGNHITTQKKGVVVMENKKINLLIVDDEEQFLKSISKSLELRDFNVTAVNRGEKHWKPPVKIPSISRSLI